MESDKFVPLSPENISFFAGDGGWRFPRKQEDDVRMLPVDLYDWVKSDIPMSVMARQKAKYRPVPIRALSWQEYYNAWFALVGFSQSMGESLALAYNSGDGCYPLQDQTLAVPSDAN